MKYTLILTVLLLSLGSAQAGSGWDVEKGKTLANSAQSIAESQSIQSTAIQPGIGDSDNQFNHAIQGEFDFNDGDWTDLHNEAIYGAF